MSDLKIEQHERFVVLSAPSELKASGLTQLEKLFAQLAAGAPRALVVDVGDSVDLGPAFVRLLVKLRRSNARVGLRIVSSSEKLGTFLKREGLNDTLGHARSVRDAEVALGFRPRIELDVRFIEPFLAATIEVLKIQCSTNATAGKLSTKQSGEGFSGEVSGLISLASKQFNGSIVITFPAATFLGLMSRMLGEEITELTTEIQDGAGELTNVIFGKAKTVLNEQGHAIQMAIPTVIVGKNHSVTSVNALGSRVVVPFESEAGPFAVEIGIVG